ncbi:MAG: hypothetical protein KC736_00935 [Candidatus Moranbacteria bacterium]|nr:hypothetical protein [Candidatus Moranbacteria bacterium]
MKKEEAQIIIYAMKTALALLTQEYETLDDEELQQKYDEATKKLQEAINIMKTYD